MVLSAEARVHQNPKSYTQTITFPSALVRDSQYPFKGDEEVEIIVIPSEAKVEIRKKGTKNFLENELKNLSKHGQTKKS